MDAAREFAAYEDLFGLPAHHVGEIVHGVMHVSPRPALAHAAAASALSEELGPPFRRGRGGPGGWIFLYEPEIHLAENVVVPDLAGWRRDGLPPDALTGACAKVAPNWLCEVLSPSTARLDRGEKLAIYRDEGVAHVWLVDPALQTLEVLRLDGATYRLIATFLGASRVRAEPFDAIELDLALLWTM
jgi:Putative restriction endonuclease